MRPFPSTAVIRIDPAHQPLWRDADTIQFGIDRRAELTLSEHWHEPLLAELQRGIRSGSFDVLAHGLGAPRDEARKFLRALRPVLHERPLQPPRVSVAALHPGDHSTELWARDTLQDLGFFLSDAADPGAVAIVLVRGAAVARAFAGHLADDRAHLPIAFDRGGATIGPLVLPGRTPCLTCRDAEETTRDPAWPLLHAQLAGQSGRRISGARVTAATTVAAELLRVRSPGGQAIRLSADGSRQRRRIGFDAACSCREPLPRSLPGTATPPAGRAPAPTPTRPKACALPA